MNRQRGISLIGLLIVSGLLVFFAIIGFKLMPSYIEYFTVQSIIRDMAHSPELRGGTIRDVQTSFDRRSTIDNVNSVKGSDLEVEKTGDGWNIIATWSARVPLFANLNACIDFEAKN
jgi:Domain of unknown function (DUF4845)